MRRKIKNIYKVEREVEEEKIKDITVKERETIYSTEGHKNKMKENWEINNQFNRQYTNNKDYKNNYKSLSTQHREAQ